ncbi:hypothetical protein [Pseudoxanthomonas winnipegensis]|uniref:Uncharacterized protein n=1 Tax=Pseudoxanthomonas winnipegensis TaxID=2480810 RepID=A0A4V2HCJ4_9GAMM|nr:hypothetical protein [Pseudoxanthomonas winnipegensis]TAA20339.1 hypothetical protein EA660_18290 [Pseudoxanthomonas winnipegensis]
MTKDEVFASLVQKFTSGNSTLVTQAVITRDEFHAMFLALRDAKKDEARLARVEALADEWDKTAEVTHYTSGMQVHCSEELRQALKGE